MPREHWWSAEVSTQVIARFSKGHFATAMVGVLAASLALVAVSAWTWHVFSTRGFSSRMLFLPMILLLCIGAFWRMYRVAVGALLLSKPALEVRDGSIQYAGGWGGRFRLADVKAVTLERARRGFGERRYLRITLNRGKAVWIMDEFLQEPASGVRDRLSELVSARTQQDAT